MGKCSVRSHKPRLAGSVTQTRNRFGALGKSVKPSVFQAENRGFKSHTPCLIFVTRSYLASNSKLLSPWPNWQGNGLLSRKMWVRLPPDSFRMFEACSYSLIWESGAGMTCQHHRALGSGFKSRLESLFLLLIGSCSSTGQSHTLITCKHWIGA